MEFVLSLAQSHRIIEYLGLEGTFKGLFLRIDALLCQMTEMSDFRRTLLFDFFDIKYMYLRFLPHMMRILSLL